MLLVIAIALYPQFALKRSDKTVTSVTSLVSQPAPIAADVLPGRDAAPRRSEETP